MRKSSYESQKHGWYLLLPVNPDEQPWPWKGPYESRAVAYGKLESWMTRRMDEPEMVITRGVVKGPFRRKSDAISYFEWFKLNSNNQDQDNDRTTEASAPACV